MKKKRKKAKVKISRKMKVFRLSEKQLREGAEDLLNRESSRILHYIQERKKTEKGSKEYNELTDTINILVRGYNLTAELWGMKTI